jgi:hypothetical protein
MIAHVRLDAAEEALVMREAAIIAADVMLAEALLTRDEAASLLRVTTKTLNLLPIQRVKLGGATRYRRQDVLSHIQASLEK